MHANAPDEATIRARTTQLGNAIGNLAVLKAQFERNRGSPRFCSAAKITQTEQDQAKRTQKMIDRMSSPVNPVVSSRPAPQVKNYSSEADRASVIPFLRLGGLGLRVAGFATRDSTFANSSLGWPDR